jgi:hypothetical protein
VIGTNPAGVDIKVTERLAYLCDVRLEAGEEGFAEQLALRERGELQAILVEAVDALVDAEEQHQREVRRMAERLSERD